MNEIEPIRLGGIFDNEQKHQAGSVWDKENISPTIDTMQGGYRQPMIVASRGRNPDNPSDRTPGNYVEQRLEPNSEGICNTLTSVQKDNLVLEPKVKCLNPNSPQSQRVYEKDGVMNTIDVGTYGRFNILESQYRIRKLTPKECWRLMAFTDEDFHKAEQVNSNTQLYKQAGNSICVNVLEVIFKQMMKEDKDV